MAPAPNSLRRRPLLLGLGLIACLSALVFPAAGAWAQESGHDEARVALVIGNADYMQVPLRNATNDAREMGAALRELGFDVLQLEDASMPEMIDAMREFLTRARSSAVRVVYLAGHGVQLKGKNYFVPVDAVLEAEEDLPTKTANVTEFIQKLALMRTGVNVVILDACRTGRFPLGERTRGAGTVRSLAPGLARTPAPRGTLIAFSTAPGSVAFDGSEGNSAYVRHLVENMRVPGLPVEMLFKRVRIAVSQETGQRQIPWETSSLIGEFCFRSLPAGECEGGPALTGGH